MTATHWMRFQWDLSRSAIAEPAIERPMVCRPAENDEEQEVLDVLCKSVALDSSLGEGGRDLQEYFRDAFYKVWRSKDRRALAVLHGDRIVGASVFLVGTEESSDQLFSGPCVLSEYRSRGLGKFLLQASLVELKNAGVGAPSAICKRFSTLAKYVYPKFGGNGAPCKFSPIMAER